MKQTFASLWILFLYFIFAIGLAGGFDHGLNWRDCLIGIGSAILAPLIIWLTWLALKHL